MKFIKSLLEAKYTQQDHDIFRDDIFTPKQPVEEPATIPNPHATETPQRRRRAQPAPQPAVNEPQQAAPAPEPQQAAPAPEPQQAVEPVRVGRHVSEIPENVSRGFYGMRDHFARITEAAMEHLTCWYYIQGAEGNNPEALLDTLMNSPRNVEMPEWDATVNGVFNYETPLRCVFVNGIPDNMTRLFVHHPARNAKAIFQWYAHTNTDLLPVPADPAQNESMDFKGFLIRG